MVTSLYDDTNELKHQLVSDYFDFHFQPAVNYDPSFQLSGSASLVVDCFYDQRNAHPSTTGRFGQFTYDEMCESCVM